MTRRQQMIAWMAIIVITFTLLIVLRDMLLPFIAAMAIAYLLDPAADWMERRGVRRWLATLLIIGLFFVVATLIVVLLVPLVSDQFAKFMDHLPEYVAWFNQRLLPYVQGVAGSFGIDLTHDPKTALAGQGEQVMKVVGGVLTGLLGGGQAIFNVLSLLVITPVVGFYLLRDWDRMIAQINDYLPLDHAETIREQAREIDKVLAGFVRGQMLVCLFLAAFYGLGLTLFGLQFGLFIGITAGMISFIPYVGTTLGFVVGIGVAIAQFWNEPVWIAAVAGVFIVGQMIEGNVLHPVLIGDRVGLHPVWIMFALLAGGSLFGFVGILVSVPLFAVIGVLARFTLERYRQSYLYRPGAPPKKIE
ncbi:AI-2E family transporter [Ferrovibrio terrae]|uniref:AI-2E family transporter n=1 Tax=Ferrovibrio terrae TaxID=2594003 RepID=A0A516H679_9PROT|nr:AI-2E family transporter [Ferrovibrio terrae]QDO99279.1 AI-2E family transporter [Ferrovibrio terrae]